MCMQEPTPGECLSERFQCRHRGPGWMTPKCKLTVKSRISNRGEDRRKAFNKRISKVIAKNAKNFLAATHE